MGKRKIIKIEEEKCNGCGLCIPNCPEGAMQVIDGKARLISDLFCDGLGACIGHCPEGAISIEERDADLYDEKKVMANIVKQGPNVIKAHLDHLKAHNEALLFQEALDYLKAHHIAVPKEEGACNCPGSKVVDLRSAKKKSTTQSAKAESELMQWPVQIHLVSSRASFFNDADLLIAADCVPFAYANFHQDLLKDKVLLVGCPKLDDVSVYQEKITEIFKGNSIKSITYAHMEVPCCLGLVKVIQQALIESGKEIPFAEAMISIKGERLK